MTTLDRGAQLANEKIRWFFGDEGSRYELGEVTRLCRTTKDNIQNWVRRDMLVPDEVTPGRRIYGPLTTADIRVATLLVDMEITPTTAFFAARQINRGTLAWYSEADPKRKRGMPEFNRDVRDQVAVLAWPPSRSSHDSRDVFVSIIPPERVKAILADCSYLFPLSVIPIGRCWIDLAEDAHNLKQLPPRKRTR